MRSLMESSDVFLRRRGIKASFQRIKIFDYLQRTREHPSVSTIFDELHPSIPSLSRATVYNTINLFVEKHLVTPVQVDGPEARYDLTDPLHSHFYCVRCEKIFDIEVDPPTPPSDLQDFQINEAQIVFKGFCPDCRARPDQA